MKKHIKLFEEFNPGDFLEDFDIPVFSVDRLMKLISEFEYKNTTLMELISEGDPYEEFERNRTYITVKNSSEYYFDHIASRNFRSLDKLIKSGNPPYLNIDWEITFLHDYEIADEDNGKHEHSIYVEIEARCTYSENDFYKNYHSSFRITRSNDLDSAIKKQIISLNDNIQNIKYEVAYAIHGSELAIEFNSYLIELSKQSK